MKKLLLFVILSLGLSAYGQDDQLPDSILHSFNMKFPQVKSFDYWELENEVYSIDFYRGGTMYTARFDTKGVWIETGEIISDSDIPSALLAYAKKIIRSSRFVSAKKLKSLINGFTGYASEM